MSEILPTLFGVLHPYGVLSLSWYVVMYVNYIVDYAKMRKYFVLYLLVPVGMYFIFNMTETYLLVQIFYFIATYLITMIDENPLYLLLGISLSAFISEYWELPIFIRHYIMFGRFQNTTIWVILSRLLMIMPIMYFIKEIKMNLDDFKKYVFKHSIIYLIVGTYVVYYTINNEILFFPVVGWLMKIIVFASFYMFILDRHTLIFNNAESNGVEDVN